MILALRRRHRAVVAILFALVLGAALFAFTHPAPDPVMDTLPPLP